MIWFSEGYAWAGKRIAWIAVINPLTRAQTVTVRLLRAAGGVLERALDVPARTRQALEVAPWFGLEGDHAFGLEVECTAACAASLVMWDAAYTVPAVSAPIVGCR